MTATPLQSKEETQRLICSALNSKNLKSYQLTKVAKCGGAAPGGGVAVINTSHHEQLFGHGRRHNSSTTGSRDETHQYRATATCHLAGHSVGFADLVTPVTSPDWNDGQLGQDDGSTDSCSYLLRALHSQTNMAVVVANGNKGL